jgi:hypothetical protein
MELGVSTLLGPEVEGNRSEFVDQRVGEAVLAKVDGLEVSVAGVAAFDADVWELVGGIDRKFGMIFLVAAGADDAAELPFAETESTEQVAACAVAHGTQDAQRRFAAAKRAERVGVILELKRNAGADEFGVGLEKGESEKFGGVGRRLRGLI